MFSTCIFSVKERAANHWPCIYSTLTGLSMAVAAFPCSQMTCGLTQQSHDVT